MAQSTEPITVLAGRYALERELGRSATGIVWSAEDLLLHRTVSVKLIQPRLADDAAFAAALRTECRRVAEISAPGLSRLLDLGEQDGITFLVREHAPGRSVRERVGSGPAAPWDAVRTGIALARALEDAHARGVLHLALDADDVVVDEDGAVHVTDLGIGAAIAASRRREAAELLGRARLAPEQLEGAPIDARTDVHAAGAVLFELLTGEAPAGRTSARSVRAEIPRPIDRVVSVALQPDPARRFTSARALAEALERSVEAEVPAIPQAVRSTNVLAWVGVPMLIVGLAAAAITVGLWMGRLEVGGPLGVRPARPEPTPGEVASTPVRPLSVSAIDPFGDGVELPSNAPLAIDGNAETAWRSENYFDGELGKPGMGLLLDLGEPLPLLALRLWTPHPGFVFHVALGDDPLVLVGTVGDAVTAASTTRVPLEGTARYVLVWITSVVPVDDGNRAEVSEVRVVVATTATGDADA